MQKNPFFHDNFTNMKRKKKKKMMMIIMTLMLIMMKMILWDALLLFEAYRWTDNFPQSRVINATSKWISQAHLNIKIPRKVN